MSDERKERSTGDDGAVTIRQGSTFFDLKTVALLVGGALTIGGSWAEQKYALTSARYEIQAEIIRVETAASRDKDETNNRLTNLERTTCAIAKKVGAETGCP